MRAEHEPFAFRLDFFGQKDDVERMSHFLLILAMVALLAVAAVLAVGIYSLFKGGAFGERWSNKLMRLRVLMQGIAIIILIALAWTMHHH